MREAIHLVILFALLLLAACGGDPEVTALLDVADSLTAQQPDSALRLLQSGNLSPSLGKAGRRFNGNEGWGEAWSRSQRMRHALLTARAMNKVCVPFTSDSAMREVARYYDRHGTPGEQVEAHYLLGCVYRDLGEAPRAISTWKEAIGRADTLNPECNYAIMSRIHAQSALLYGKLLQTRSQLEELRLAIYCADKAHDTLMSIECFSQTGNCYKILNMTDSSIHIFERASKAYMDAGYKERAAIVLSGAITPLVECGELDRARLYCERYERESGLFNREGTIRQGREIYYYIKGNFLMAAGETDSAETMFRSLAATGHTPNDRIASSKGLLAVYERRGTMDSIAKYAVESYVLNDSAYSRSEMESVQRFRALYDYTQHKLEAERTRAAASYTRMVLYLVASLLSTAIVCILFLFYSYRKRKRMDLQDRQHKLDLLERAQTELQKLYHQDTMNAQAAIGELRKEIGNYKRQIEKSVKKRSDTEAALKESEVVRRLRNNLESNPPQQATRSDFKTLKDLINEHIPSFYSSLNPPESVLRPAEYEICLLVRVHFKPSEIAKLTGRTEDYVAHTRKRILYKVFKKNGSPRELDLIILAIS